MSQQEKNQDKDLDQIDEDISFHRILVFLIIIAVLAFYLCMKEVVVTDAAQHWGPVGDFIGGILNPIFALFAFYWLTYSVRLQIKELKETREELKKAAEAQEESARHQETIAKFEKENVQTQKDILNLQKDTLNSQVETNAAQQQQIAFQNFESLFFQLLKTKTDVTNDILVGSRSTLDRFSQHYPRTAENKINEMVSKQHKVVGKESIKDHLILFKSHVIESWEKFYTDSFLDYAGSYFRVCYHIVKIIDQNDVLKALEKVEGNDYSKKQKEYFDIFRSIFSQYELELIFFNCLSKYGNKSFKRLLEKYGMFEPLLIDNDRTNERIHALTRYAYQYDKSTYEKNDLWVEYFNKIENLKKINMHEVQENIIILWDLSFFRVVAGFSKRSIDELIQELKIVDKVDFILNYIDLSRGINIEDTKLKRLKNLIARLGEDESILKNVTPDRVEFYLSEINSYKQEIDELNKINNMELIEFVLISRIRPNEFMEFFELAPYSSK